MADFEKISFRFDIDSHKCLRDGIWPLLDLAKKAGVRFTFCVHAGRAISRTDTLRQMLFTEHANGGAVKMLSAKEKLGTRDYLYAAIVNPLLSDNSAAIKALFDSGYEINLHGGANHTVWGRHAHRWGEERLLAEIAYGVTQLQKIYPDYKPVGFSSPEFNSPQNFGTVLRKAGFIYASEHCILGTNNPLKKSDGIFYLDVNLSGEPGNVAFFENCCARGRSEEQIMQSFLRFVDLHDTTIVFDHPYFVGIHCIGLLQKLIGRILDRGYAIVPLLDLLPV